MVFDVARSVVVLFGGSTATGDSNETWEWNGDSWVQRQPAASPPGRSSGILATHPTQGRTLLFGGARVSPSLVYYGGTHEFDAAAPRFDPVGVGCVGSNGTPILFGAPSPYVGTTWRVAVDGVPNNAPAFVALSLNDSTWGNVPLPVDLGVIGMPGCLLRVSPDLILFAPSNGSSAALGVPIANSPAFAGQDLFVQALVFDAPANPFGATLSNGGVARLALL